MDKDRFFDSTFDDRKLVASSWECTGLIPALRDDEEEAEETSLYAIHEQKNNQAGKEEYSCAREEHAPR